MHTRVGSIIIYSTYKNCNFEINDYHDFSLKKVKPRQMVDALSELFPILKER